MLRHPALGGGYACWVLDSDAERVVLLDARGHGVVYVNAAPRTGDPYGNGSVLLPIPLRAGENALLFQAGRGELRAALAPMTAPALLNPRDPTTPDLLIGATEPVWAAVPVLNGLSRTVDNLAIDVTVGDKTMSTWAGAIPPLSVRKVGFRIPPTAATQPGEVEVAVRLVESGSRPTSDAVTHSVLDSYTLKLAVRRPSDKHKRTFISEIDGSVQYYAVTPAHPDGDGPQALFLSLHGANVEATNQANCYGHKTWGTLVAPTNRRKFGFDWEEWGRLDALEALADAMRYWPTDPNRVYLTGHSMGGHGAWILGATYPDRFAAVAPSAGWPDFWAYAGAAEYENPTPVERMLRRAANPSRMRELVENLNLCGVYVLHGEQDDNVPAALSRQMVRRLAEFHTDFAFHERPGAGHWWGDECVDWPPLFEFLRRLERPAPGTRARLEFATFSPGVSDRCDWVWIECQRRPLERSSVRVERDDAGRVVRATTENVRRLKLAPVFGGAAATAAARGAARFVLDGQELTVEETARVDEGWRFVRDGERWTVAGAVSQHLKGPHRYGPLRDAFRRRFALVYGTQGTPEENAASYDAARFHAETFWYRGNGGATVLSDADALATSGSGPARSLILYGNAETNAAWRALVAPGTVDVTRSGVRLGGEPLAGDDLAALFIRPNPESDLTLIGCVGGTTPAAVRYASRLPIFLSGVGFSDFLVLGTDTLVRGTGGIRAAGFFGEDWGLVPEDTARAE